MTIPDGYVLVPREPTPEMLIALTSRIYGINLTSREVAALNYRVMLDRAPKPAQSPTSEEVKEALEHAAIIANRQPGEAPNGATADMLVTLADEVRRLCGMTK